MTKASPIATLSLCHAATEYRNYLEKGLFNCSDY